MIVVDSVDDLDRKLLRLEAWRAKELEDAGDFRRAEMVADAALKRYGPHYSRTEPSILILEDAWAGALHSAGKLQQAVKVLRRLHERRSSVLGEDADATLRSANALAFALYDSGRSDESILIGEACLNRREDANGRGSLGAAQARTTLALAYEAAGRSEEAVRLHKENYRLLRDGFGEDHPDAVMSRNDLALSYQENGRVQEAIEIHKSVLSDRQRLLPADHSLIRASRNNLAQAYLVNGNVKRAVQLHQQNYDEALRTDPNSPTFLTDANNLGSTLSNLPKKRKDAIRILESTLGKAEQLFGHGGLDVVRIGLNLGVAYIADSKIQKGLEKLREALSRCEDSLDAQHPMQFECRSHVGVALSRCGATVEAVELLERNLAETKTKFGPNHKYSVSARLALANVEASRGNYSRALDLVRMAKSVSLTTLGSRHPYTGATQMLERELLLRVSLGQRRR